MKNMTKQNKLTKIIKKAIKNGWQPFNANVEFKVCTDRQHFMMIQWDDDFYDGMYDVLFNHDFAKAIFGEKKIELCIGGYCEKQDKLPVFDCTDPGSVLFIGCNWQYHLQQVVISDDPLEYYYVFITKN